MKKSALLLLIFFCFQVVHAQKKFFQSLEILPYLYFDDIWHGNKEWKKQFKLPNKPLSSNIDSLNERLERHGYTNGGRGVQLRLQKVLPLFKEASRSKLEWNIGAGHHSFRNKSLTFAKHGFGTDTNKVYLTESEQFILRQDFVDLYSSIVYNVNGKEWKWWNIFIGLGFQPSFSIGNNRILDSYRASTYQWNTAQQKWTQSQTRDTTVSAHGIKTKIYSITVPVGYGIRVTNKILLKSSMEYFRAVRKPHFEKNKYSEGLMFQFAFRYNL